MTYRGHVENGQIKLDQSVQFPEGAEVVVALVEKPVTNGEDLNSMLMRHAGQGENLPDDLAQHHDHYARKAEAVTQTFADSFYLLALFNGRDVAHKRAVAASTTLQGILVTTDWVLTETADALCGPPNRTRCARFIDDLRRSERVDIEPATRALFDAGWDLYGKRVDKDWSLTVCISFVVMTNRSITVALTGDHHFVQAGFQALLV